MGTVIGFLARRLAAWALAALIRRHERRLGRELCTAGLLVAAML